MKKLALTLTAIVVVAFVVYGVCPKPELKTFNTYSRAFFDQQGELLRITLAEDDRFRLYQNLSEISPDLIQATLLYEDQHYYAHGGVDFLALLRAFWTTYITQQRRIGASTITMQVARLRWQIASHTISGKVEQLIRAMQLSRHYSKDEILEAYLNFAPYGRNIEGIGAASLIYFNKKPNQLSLPEAMVLSVIPQNPNKRNPTTSEGYKSLLKARSNLFERWLEKFPEDQQQASFFDMPLQVRSPDHLPFLAPHFVDHLNQKLSRWDSGYFDTTLDHKKQSLIEDALTHYVSSREKEGIHNATALLVNYETMSIEAMVGSVNFSKEIIQGQVNGTTAKRSPGSTLKPFVYGLAFDEGLVHPMSLMRDAPRRFGGFTPENYDKQFMGPIVVKDALIESRNVPAVELQARLKQNNFYNFLIDAGITGLKEESFYGLALALGGGEVTMMELVTLYAMLANGGLLQDIKSLKTMDPFGGKQLLSPEASYLVLDILKDNPEPEALHFDSRLSNANHVAWKTGTSWAYRDAWAVGVSGPYVLAVWVGNFDGSGDDVFIGRTAAGPLMFRIMRSVFPDQEWQLSDNIPVHTLNIKQVQMCEKTGDLPGKYCPATVDAWFIPGVSPIKVSNIHRAIPIDANTGLRACWHDQGETELEVYEFWPSDFLQLFQQAGLSLKTPPRYSKTCDLDQTATSGQLPVISSPQTTIEYVLQSDVETDQQIPFTVTVDPDVEKLFWFVDGRYVGASKRSKPLFWPATNGEFSVSVVDNVGRSAITTMKVRLVR